MYIEVIIEKLVCHFLSGQMVISPFLKAFPDGIQSEQSEYVPLSEAISGQLELLIPEIITLFPVICHLPLEQQFLSYK